MALLNGFFPCKTEQKTIIKTVHIGNEVHFHKTMIDLLNAAKNEKVLGLLLVIDNYGGRTTNFFMLHDLIKKVARLKPVVALVAGAALSCGYAIASAADYIVAGNLSELGNIGVISEKWYYKEPSITVKEGDAITTAKLEMDLFRAGECKDLHNPNRQLSDKEKQYIQENVDKIYHTFLALVAQNRSLDLDLYTTWAEGRIFIGREALELGLIDEIGTMLEAENKLAELIQQRNPDMLLSQALYYLPQ